MSESAAPRNLSTAPFTEARHRLSDILDEVSTTGNDLVITRYGRPAAVVMGHDEYESLIETLNVLADADTMAAIREAEAEAAAGELEDLD